MLLSISIVQLNSLSVAKEKKKYHGMVILSPVGLLFCVDVTNFGSDKASPYCFSGFF